MGIEDLNLAPTQQLNDENYQAPAERRSLPAPGRYTLQLPDEFDDDAFGSDRGPESDEQGQLTVSIDPTIVGSPDNLGSEGYGIRFQRCNLRQFPRGKDKVPASNAGDLMVALGRAPSELPADPNEAIEFIRANWAGQTFDAECRWDLWNRHGGPDGKTVRIRGGHAEFDAERLRKLGFPVAEDREGPQDRVPSPFLTDENTGDPTLMFVNFRVGRYIPLGE